jgi:hypothetical protein
MARRPPRPAAPRRGGQRWGDLAEAGHRLGIRGNQRTARAEREALAGAEAEQAEIAAEAGGTEGLRGILEDRNLGRDRGGDGAHAPDVGEDAAVVGRQHRQRCCIDEAREVPRIALKAA